MKQYSNVSASRIMNAENATQVRIPAVAMSKWEFEQCVINCAMTCGLTNRYNPEDDCHPTINGRLCNALASIIREYHILDYIGADYMLCETRSVDIYTQKKYSCLGLQTCDGVPFFGMLVGTANTMPVYVFVTLVGESIAVCVPVRGNMLVRSNGQYVPIHNNITADELKAIQAYGFADKDDLYTNMHINYAWEAIMDDMKYVLAQPIKPEMPANIGTNEMDGEEEDVFEEADWNAITKGPSKMLNFDAKIRQGGRTIVKISRDEFMQKVKERVMSIADGEYEEDGSEYELFSTLLYNDPVIQNDNKFNINFENIFVDTEDYDDESIGWFLLDNGAGVYGVVAGGDWEQPAFFVLYWDGKNIRMYTPSAGNVINLDCKCLFGSEQDSDRYNLETLKKKYQKLGIWVEGADEYYTILNLSHMYLAKYGLTMDMLSDNYPQFNNQFIMADLNARLECKP